MIIIGTSKEPENGDLKELKGFFDKFLYFPYPDYSSRRLVLRYYLEYQICEGKVQYSTVQYSVVQCSAVQYSTV